VAGVRLYAPNLQHSISAAPGYYFLTTDTPELMRWLASRAEEAGAHLPPVSRTLQRGEPVAKRFDLHEFGTTRYLVGRTGPLRPCQSAWAGKSEQFLFGLEHE